MKKILSPTYSLKFRNIILFMNWGLIFFANGHICNVILTLPNFAKIDVENDNVVSTLSNVAKFNIEIHKVVGTLLNVVNYNVEIPNVVSTLIWCWTDVEMFSGWLLRGVLQKKFSEKFHKILREMAVVESLSNTVKNFQPVRLTTLLKRDPGTGVLEQVICRSSANWEFLNNSQNSKENNYAGVSF